MRNNKLPFLPDTKKSRWHAGRRTDPEMQAFTSNMPGTEHPDSDQQEASSASESLQRWLNAGGKADNASIYHVEIFVGTA